MEQKLKESVGTLLAHIIKIDNRDLESQSSLFCEIMGENFDCDKKEAEAFLYSIVNKDYDLDEHVDIISRALSHDQLSKFHLLEQLNHIIYSDTISDEDYKVFENIRDKLFNS
ncbi:hypothetical protein MNB_SV-5-1319 [hydrothermal vent metagenome]|uniref:Co-chaperone DjlA N-terminal domain-containing protein n=1 Tax=hydrothermal vent metagenome TaxID=652676 RepID=A0A1W1EBR3_9ZZZZ